MKSGIGGGICVDQLDLLSQPLSAGKGVSREGAEFYVESPWALADFGRVRIRSGWWRLECVGGPDQTEIRLSSDQTPLIIVPARDGSARIYIGDDNVYDVSLLISPWPGVYSYSMLRLYRLKSAELAMLMVAAASRLARRKDPWGLLQRAARRLIAGRPLGLNLPTNATPKAEDRPVTRRHPVGGGAVRQIALGGVIIHARRGDRIHRDAAAIARSAFDRDPALKVLYADAIEAGRLVPHPRWDPDLAIAGAYDNAPMFTRAEVVISCISDAVAEWGQTAIERIPLPLVERDVMVQMTMPARALPKLTRPPRVSAIIPTKYRMDLLEKCLCGLIDKTDYPDLEVIVVDNDVSDPRFDQLLSVARKSLRVEVIADKGSFNFSRLVNSGVKAASGEIILLLNDDVEPIETGWLHRIVSSAVSPDVGAVGARLLYPDHSVQHAGVVLGLGGTCGHLWRGLSEESAAENPYITSPGGRLAVTGACLAVGRTKFDAIGGFNEVSFPVAYNDIDFCLRLHASGLRNIYRGDAKLIHHESQSRGSDDASIVAHRRQSAEAAEFFRRWRHVISSAPYFSPAFDPNTEIGAAHSANFAPASSYLEL